MQRALLLILTLIIAAPAGAADEFYTVRLRSGEEAYRAHRYTEAAENLRVACFGLLDQPLYYSEALVGLALAQAATSNLMEVDVTLARFVEVERLFNVYASVKLEPAVRKEFETLAARRINPESLAALPSLSRLIETREQKLSRMSPAERRKAIEGLVKTEPRNVAWPLALAREEAARSEWKNVITWADAALAADDKNVEALALRAHARTQRRELAAALADLIQLPKARVDADSSLTADLFVCRVAGRELDEARALAPRLDEPSRTRSDVKAALKKLAADQAAAEAKLAADAKAAEAKVIAEAKVAEAKPVQTPAPKRPVATPTAIPQPKATPAPTPKVVATPKPTATPRPPGTPTPAPTPSPSSSPAIRPAAPSPSPSLMATPAVPTAFIEADAIIAARRLCNSGKAGEAVQLLRGIRPPVPPSRNYQKALLEAVCLDKDWKSAVTQAGQMEPFQNGEEAYVFYASIAYFETGAVDHARALLAGARSKISSSPYVDYYSKKILGAP